ncbi:phosphotransferase [Paenibacillus eucommiae]|uniref:Homoserine kinase type II n=1 Tax=Paenibacillus eucommiae TaxID=1355755 RepID=A0ABS4IS77_9BACL|nr:phosphotransferase [Paenibacillus eucommiae]MBP1989741.1 homoserine kinase type II [Paenibacillus eucommiae]
MSIQNIDFIQNEIISDIEGKFGWKVYGLKPSALGYGNLKWIMETDYKPIFVKQYCKIRNRRGLEGVRQALKYQDLMQRDQLPCQPVYSFNGEYVLTTGSGEEYMISGVSEGKLVEAGQINSHQMNSLGEATGRMHMWMRTFMPRLKHLQWELPSKTLMFEKLESNFRETKELGNDRYLEAIEKQIIILEQLDMEIFNACTKGWAHWDMHVDNILFHEDRLADILDFDRLHFVYPDFDISRALLSGALSSGSILNTETTKAYIEGYRNHAALTIDQLMLSIKLTWYKEFKWVHEQFSQDKAMSRFIEEMIWIGKEWNNLEEIFKSL